MLVQREEMDEHNKTPVGGIYDVYLASQTTY